MARVTCANRKILLVNLGKVVLIVRENACRYFPAIGLHQNDYGTDALRTMHAVDQRKQTAVLNKIKTKFYPCV